MGRAAPHVGVVGRAFAAAALALAACAVGVAPADDDGGGTGGGTIRPDGDVADVAGDDAESSFDTGRGGDDASAGDSGGDGSSAACAATNACTSARDIGQVSGDTSPTNNTVTVTGTTSEWLTINVTEDDNSVSGSPVKLKVTLASPASANFDLYLYVDSSGSTTSRACMPTPSASSKNPLGQVDEASLSWGEGSVANGSNDSRIVTIEVRNVSGTCSPSDTWTLVAKGNQ